MQNYSPHNPLRDDWSPWDDGTTLRISEYYHNSGKAGIVEIHWHWFAPMNSIPNTRTYYASNTWFDVSKAVQPGTSEYAATIRDLDAIAFQLRMMRNVPILWRPLHDADGGWYWWGAKGPEAFKKLYYLMKDRFINHHGLKNLIWVWSVN